jgi:hypothetical protein
MSITKGIVDWIRGLLIPRNSVPAISAPAAVVPVQTPAPPPAARPLQESRPRPSSAVELLQYEPDITAEDLAARSGVTLSYARGLVRKRRNTPPPKAQQRRPAAAAKAAPLEKQVRDLALRLDSTEGRMLRTTAPPAATCRRTDVLERSSSGMAASAIAEELAIPQGEVEFMVKVARLAHKRAKKN